LKPLEVIALPHREGVRYVAFEERPLAEARELFCIYCSAKGLSPRTIHTCIFSVARRERFITGDPEAHGIPGHKELRRFIGEMLDPGNVSASAMEQVEIPRVPESIPTVLTDDQMAARVKAANKPG